MRKKSVLTLGEIVGVLQDTFIDGAIYVDINKRGQLLEKNLRESFCADFPELVSHKLDYFKDYEIVIPPKTATYKAYRALSKWANRNLPSRKRS